MKRTIAGISANRLIDRIVGHYLSSDEFKGLSLRDVVGTQINRVDKVISFLTPLVETQRITVRCDGGDLNPFIKRMPDLSPEKELLRLRQWRGGLLIAYPSRKELERHVRPQDYVGRPFTLEMALGAAWLDFRVFDLSILEQYRNDPRYYYSVSDIHGSISVYDEHYSGHKMRESDEILLEHFGFAYDKDLNRAVAVFLIELHKLSAQHQQIWEARRLQGEFELHPIFWENQIRGWWAKDSVVTDAILWEMHRINECCGLMGRPALFKKDYWECDRPRNFCFLIRPTAKEFADFCQTLDKMLSENLNRAFFKGEVDEKEEHPRSDGKIEVVTKGTITLLLDWLFKVWIPADRQGVEEKLRIFKRVRGLRNPQAHKLMDDVFDQKYIADQRKLLGESYDALRILRGAFETHPRVKSQLAKVDESGEILLY